MHSKNPKVDAYLSKASNWQKEMEQLRKIILDCGLTEELKWNKPCYTFQGSNIVVIQGFKEYCALLFMKGVLLKDPDGILIKTGENTRVGRQIRFNSVKEVIKLQTILKAYIHEAVAVEQAGLKVTLARNKEPIPEELKNKFDKHPAFKKAFLALTPGRQRVYILYFSAPKQSSTRESRIEKYTQQILNGKGMNDDYLQKKK